MAFVALSRDLAVAGEFPFTWGEFRQLAQLVQDEAGIVLQDSKANLVYSRLSKRVRELGLADFRAYCALIEKSETERHALIAAMTTNVTRFFREPHHFEHFESQIVPPLAAAARRGQRIRLWSAACSSGEEPYSMALTLLRAMPDAAQHDILILATDIDPNMLETGRAALYPAARLADIPKPMQAGIEEAAAPGQFRIGAAARAMVQFRPLNLIKPWPMRGHFDTVFCRNVMIYFDQKTQNEIWLRFAERMAPDAMLYIGHSERIAPDAAPFTLAGQTAYRRIAR